MPELQDEAKNEITNDQNFIYPQVIEIADNKADPLKDLSDKLSECILAINESLTTKSPIVLQDEVATTPIVVNDFFKNTRTQQNIKDSNYTRDLFIKLAKTNAAKLNELLTEISHPKKNINAPNKISEIKSIEDQLSKISDIIETELEKFDDIEANTINCYQHLMQSNTTIETFLEDELLDYNAIMKEFKELPDLINNMYLTYRFADKLDNMMRLNEHLKSLEISFKTITSSSGENDTRPVLDAQETEKTEIQRQVTILEKNSSKLESKIQNLEHTIATQEDEIDRFTVKIQQSQPLYADAIKKLALAEAIIIQLDEMIIAHGQEKTDLQSEIVSLQKKNKILEKQLSNVQKFTDNNAGEVSNSIQELEVKKASSTNDIEKINRDKVENLLMICLNYKKTLGPAIPDKALEKKLKIVNQLIATLLPAGNTSTKTASQKVSDFRETFSTDKQNTLSKDRDSTGMSVVKWILTVLSGGLAAYAGIFSVKGDLTTKQIKKALGGIKGGNTEDNAQPKDESPPFK